MEASEDARGTCTPCHGTGKLISGLGGTPHEVTCAWCGGSGRFQPGRNAQEHPAETPPPRAAGSPGGATDGAPDAAA